MISLIRHSLLFLCVLALLPAAQAQIGFNSPAGLSPVRDMEIYARDIFVVQQKYIPTTAPISGTFALSCATLPTDLTAAAGVLLDPGGTGNYPASLTCLQRIQDPSLSLTTGYELVFTLLNTEANGDSVIISDPRGGRIAFSGSTLPPVLLVPSSQVTITFRSDADGNVGAGFALQWRRVQLDPSPVAGGNGVFGYSIQFDLRKGALVGGLHGVGALQRAGDYSTALGRENRATGGNATAIGYINVAGGFASTALGFNNIVNGYAGVALGQSNIASATNAVALGSVNKATGYAALALGRDNTVDGVSANAIGYLNTASGDYSTAIGNYTSTNDRIGAMCLGDYSTTNSLSATTSHQFNSRFAGGYRLFTNPAMTLGASLAANGTSWATISDSTRKERFLPIDGPDLLRKISGMKLTTWNYKQQRDRRHYGPMAQEFFALFGHDKWGDIGCDTLITTQDIEGLTLSAVQALIRENEQLKTRLNAVENENEHLRAETQNFASLQAEMNNRLHLLERAMLTRRERVSLRKTKP